MDFIPANESPLFIKVFRWYTWFLFKRRFKTVWLKQEYSPCSECKTLYYLNHHSWWDGLIPLLLNEFRFHQQARAIMEDKQMRKYPFFQKIGAFSVNREDRRGTVTALRYAVSSFQRPHSSLFIYPEGTITPVGNPMDFEGGLSWLHKQVEDIDVVPIAVHMHTIRHDKPELHLHVGTAQRIERSVPRSERTQYFEQQLSTMLQKLRQTAGFEEAEFERFL